ncbi:MAG TPA: hypothetical protein VE288_06925 [Rubrobacteraceae bacterium]|jgi:uncharacterized coiled-coil DUF342 family protein|nr:hypothetical protein [Rubrobacteraceae bacterium]
MITLLALLDQFVGIPTVKQLELMQLVELYGKLDATEEVRDQLARKRKEATKAIARLDAQGAEIRERIRELEEQRREGDIRHLS